MRPINKSIKPNPIFNPYDTAKDSLIKDIGPYCSYCETAVYNLLAVEHIYQKEFHPDKQFDWNNFLLSCTYCNSAKNKDANLNLSNYFFPHNSNTAYTFIYDLKTFKVSANPDLDINNTAKAENTIKLFNLNFKTMPSNSKKEAPRFVRRKEECESALISLKTYEEMISLLNSFPISAEEKSNLINNYIDNIGSLMKGHNFSIWLTAFKCYPEIKRVIFEKFPGTSLECFTPSFDPLPIIDFNS